MQKHQSLLHRLLKAVFVLPAAILAQVAIAPSGSGTGSDPYRIESLDNLFWLSQTPNVWKDTIVQVSNIDASSTASWDDGKGFAPIGDSLAPFRGSYDARGFVITGLTITRPQAKHVGLFGYAGKGGVLRSFRLVDGSIRGGVNTGALAGVLDSATVISCRSTGIVDGDASVGGLVGLNRAGVVESGQAAGTVHAVEFNAGGLVGTVRLGSVRASQASAVVSCDGGHAGGLVGANSKGRIANSFAVGTVEGGGDVGGLIGYNDGDLATSFATGRVRGELPYPFGRSPENPTGDAPAGGLIGYLHSGDVATCAWDSQSTGQKIGYGRKDVPTFGARGIATDSMNRTASFPGWDFVDMWTVREGVHYPFLLGQANEQAIVFPELPVGIVDQADFTPPATSGSGGAVAFSSSNPTVAIVVAGKIHVVGPGETMITATQSGDSLFHAAAPVERRLRVIGPPPGRGSAEDPWQIANLDDLYWLSRDTAAWAAGKHFIQTQDIRASATKTWFNGAGFMPIGSISRPFQGTYDGQGHVLMNLNINRPDADHVGLFGHIGARASIAGLFLTGDFVIGKDYTGSLVGSSDSGKIRGCGAQVIVQGHDFVGGLVGRGTSLRSCGAYGSVSGHDAVGGLIGAAASSDTLLDCIAEAATVTSQNSGGGLVGVMDSLTLLRCYSRSTVHGGSTVGGLVGRAELGRIEQCFAAGDSVRGDSSIGGLVGRASGTRVANSYSSGVVRGSRRVGGLVGWMQGGQIEKSYSSSPSVGDSCGGLVGLLGGGDGRFVSSGSSYWDVQASRCSSGVGGLWPGWEDQAPLFEGLATAQMMSRAIFAGWDFDKMWLIEEDGESYPQLRLDVPENASKLVQPRGLGASLDAGWHPVDVIDLRGRRVWAGTARWTGVRWELSALGSGTWLVRARTPRGIVTTRAAVLR